ncbi:MAG TPA: hypothetical protein VE684_21945, partial [Crenalkalicoccus sp.]|nr:hypothetical protein [Crenalkalicoccus sp.]
MNAPAPEDPAREAWANVARNLARQPVKESALAMLRATVEEVREGARAFQWALRTTEARQAAGAPATTLQSRLDRARTARALPRLTQALGAAA